MSFEPLNLAAATPTVARVMGTCDTDARIADAINEVQDRYLMFGNWQGSVVAMRVCAASSCLVWPRQIGTILAYGICGRPGTIRDRWYQYLQNGPGMLSECCGCASDLIDTDPAATFEDIYGATSNVGMQCDVAEAPNTYAVIQGYDQNEQWIRTTVGGSYIDGFRLLLSTTLQVSPMLVTKVTRVVLPAARNGMARLYQVTGGSPVRPLGFYESDETVPWYRRSFVPGLSRLASQGGGSSAGCGCVGGSSSSTSSTTCCCKEINVIAKLRHIRVAAPADWLILQNLPALKLGVMAMLKEERNLMGEADAYWSRGIQLLEAEKDNYEGAGTVTMLNVVGGGLLGGGAVENDICYPPMAGLPH